MAKHMKLRKILGDNVKSCRKSMKLSQTKLAQATKVMDQTTVGRIENAAIATTVDMVEALALAFGLEPWHLFTENVDRKNPPIVRGRTATERELWNRIEESATLLGLRQ
jgi:transcriptional regulator with XRE-family HTH domain